MAANGPHANPVWSTFVFVVCMILFLFYLESMVNPMDFLVAKSFVAHDVRRRRPSSFPLVNRSEFVTYGDIINGSFDLNRIGNTLVSLHIPKTGGKAFDTHVALDIHSDSGPFCNCTVSVPGYTSNQTHRLCSCERDNDITNPWFFSQLTVGWPCGVHAGWTDLTLSCVDNELSRRTHKKVSRR